MDFFIQLNYCYPGTSDAARFHVSQPQIPPLRVPIPNIQEQTHPGDGYARPDPSKITHARSSLDITAGYDLRPHQKSTVVGPPGDIQSDPQCSTRIRYTDEPANLVDQYIPSSSDRITCTDHRPLDEIFGNVPPASGWSQATLGSGSLCPSQNETPPPRGPPKVLTYTLPIKPQLDGVVQIPLLAVDNQMSGTGVVVDFKCSDWGIGVEVKGIPMSDLLHGNVSGLESPHQRVLDGLSVTSLRFNILWPNYPPFAKMISALGTDGKSMTRAELGYEVSLAFAEFFYQITSRSISPTQPGPYTIASSPLGSTSPGIKFEQLHLITVRNTSRGEWMAEIRAVSIP